MKNNNLIKKERIWYWDTVKFLMILFVVVGHVVGYIASYGRDDVMAINLFLYTVHMPMFIFIFGLFYKEKDCLRKILFYLSSAFLLKGLLYVSYLAINGKAKFGLFYEGGVPWFMFVLAWFTAIAWLLKKVNKNVVLIVSFAISLFTGYFKNIGDFLCISRLLVFFPYFWLGTMIDPNILVEKIKKYKKYLFAPALILLIGWCAVCFWKFDDVRILQHLFSGRNPFRKDILPWGCLYRLLTHTLTLVMGAAILIVVPQKKIPVVSYMGRNTVNVYFWHYSFLVLMNKLLDMKTLVRTKEGILLLLVIGVILTFVVSLDIFNFPLKYLNKFIMNFKKRKATD